MSEMDLNEEIIRFEETIRKDESEKIKKIQDLGTIENNTRRRALISIFLLNPTGDIKNGPSNKEIANYAGMKDGGLSCFKLDDFLRIGGFYFKGPGGLIVNNYRGTDSLEKKDLNKGMLFDSGLLEKVKHGVILTELGQKVTLGNLSKIIFLRSSWIPKGKTTSLPDIDPVRLYLWAKRPEEYHNINTLRDLFLGSNKPKNERDAEKLLIDLRLATHSNDLLIATPFCVRLVEFFDIELDGAKRATEEEICKVKPEIVELLHKKLKNAGPILSKRSTSEKELPFHLQAEKNGEKLDINTWCENEAVKKSRLVILGPAGSGKSIWLLENALKILQNEKYIPILVELGARDPIVIKFFRSNPEYHHLFIYWLIQNGISRLSIKPDDDLEEILVPQLKTRSLQLLERSNRLIFCFDAWDEADLKIIQLLDETMRDRHGIIITSREYNDILRAFAGNDAIACLTTPSLTDAEKLIKSSHPDFAEAEIKKKVQAASIIDPKLLPLTLSMIASISRRDEVVTSKASLFRRWVRHLLIWNDSRRPDGEDAISTKILDIAGEPITVNKVLLGPLKKGDEDCSIIPFVSKVAYYELLGKNTELDYQLDLREVNPYLELFLEPVLNDESMVEYPKIKRKHLADMFAAEYLYSRILNKSNFIIINTDVLIALMDLLKIDKRWKDRIGKNLPIVIAKSIQTHGILLEPNRFVNLDQFHIELGRKVPRYASLLLASILEKMHETGQIPSLQKALFEYLGRYPTIIENIPLNFEGDADDVFDPDNIKNNVRPEPVSLLPMMLEVQGFTDEAEKLRESKDLKGREQAIKLLSQKGDEKLIPWLLTIDIYSQDPPISNEILLERLKSTMNPEISEIIIKELSEHRAYSDLPTIFSQVLKIKDEHVCKVAIAMADDAFTNYSLQKNVTSFILPILSLCQGPTLSKALQIIGYEGIDNRIIAALKKRLATASEEEKIIINKFLLATGNIDTSSFFKSINPDKLEEWTLESIVKAGQIGLLDRRFIPKSISIKKREKKLKEKKGKTGPWSKAVWKKYYDNEFELENIKELINLEKNNGLTKIEATKKLLSDYIKEQDQHVHPNDILSEISWVVEPLYNEKNMISKWFYIQTPKTIMDILEGIWSEEGLSGRWRVLFRHFGKSLYEKEKKRIIALIREIHTNTDDYGHLIIADLLRRCGFDITTVTGRSLQEVGNLINNKKFSARAVLIAHMMIRGEIDWDIFNQEAKWMKDSYALEYLINACIEGIVPQKHCRKYLPWLFALSIKAYIDFNEQRRIDEDMYGDCYVESPYWLIEKLQVLSGLIRQMGQEEEVIKKISGFPKGSKQKVLLLLTSLWKERLLLLVHGKEHSEISRWLLVSGVLCKPEPTPMNSDTINIFRYGWLVHETIPIWIG